MNWFKRRGYIFIPAAVPGWIIFTAVVAYLVYAFIDIDSRSHSVSDTLMIWSFNVLIAGLIYSAIGYFTAEKER